MCRYQNCWRGDETLARKTFEHVVVVRVMIVTIAEASAASMLLGPGKYSIFRRNSAADSLQMQRRVIGNASFNWGRVRGRLCRLTL
jgi:hypothetical protein